MNPSEDATCTDPSCTDPVHLAHHHHHSKPESNTVAQRLKHIYSTSKFTDLTIIFSPKDKLRVHRLILAMSSPVFESMLYGSSAVGPVLHLPEDSPEGFRWLLDYIYCDASQFTTTTVALEVSHLASKYQMNVLKFLCSEYLKRALNDVNYLKVYNAAVQLNNPDLIMKCSQLMQGSGGDVYSSQQVSQLSRHALKHLLQQPCNIVNEVTVFRALVTWGKYQLGLRGRNATPGDLRQEVEEFLPSVRFLTMTTDQVVEHVGSSEIFTPDELCTLLKCIKKQQGATLPSFCCPTRECRDHVSQF